MSVYRSGGARVEHHQYSSVSRFRRRARSEEHSARSLQAGQKKYLLLREGISRALTFGCIGQNNTLTNTRPRLGRASQLARIFSATASALACRLRRFTASSTAARRQPLNKS